MCLLWLCIASRCCLSQLQHPSKWQVHLSTLPLLLLLRRLQAFPSDPFPVTCGNDQDLLSRSKVVVFR